MKVFVDKIPVVSNVEDECIFAKPTDTYTETSDFLTIELCECLFTRKICEVQRFEIECPFLQQIAKEKGK